MKTKKIPGYILFFIFSLFLSAFIFEFRNIKNLFTPKIVRADSATDWNQLQYGPQHKGRSSVQVDPPYQAAWIWMDKTHIVTNFVSQPGSSITDGFADIATYTQPVVFAIQMQPIVAQNQVFFGALNGVFYSVNAETGANVWDFTTGGPIVTTAAYSSSTIVVPSMDGNLYGLNASTGAEIWRFPTGAGISAPPVIYNGVVYSGSRDGSFYAINLTTGQQIWKYDNRVEPADADSPFNKAPIFSAAAISEDGSTVFFGAENTFFYALNTADGTEKWSPKKQNGTSFQGTWPVVSGDLVFITTMSSYGTPEYNMEAVLSGLPATPTWAQQRDAINTWLDANPQWRLLKVYNVADGTEPFQIAAGPYSPFGMPFIPPVVDNSSRVLWPYWRVKDATFFTQAACYGSNYGLDIGEINVSTGDKVNLTNNQSSKFCPEIDNVFNVTVGGTNLYLQEAFRGAVELSLTTGAYTRVTAAIAHWDWGDFRSGGAQVIYYGNDSEPATTTIDPRPPKVTRSTAGLGSGVVLASVNGTSMMFINETNVSGIVALTHKP